MTVADKIVHHTHHLPESIQVEILDFVEYLEVRTKARDQANWTVFSLSHAMRDMDSEDFQYWKNDLK
jgi:hypothetical protein